MNIALVGYGQMGKLLDELAPDFDLNVVAKVDPQLKTDLASPKLSKAEVCIEFTNPESAFSNIKKLATNRKNIVVGTTGWIGKIAEVKKLVEKFEIGLVYGANFSVGMNLFFQIVKSSAKLIAQTDYDPFGWEMHHKKKQDSPSGTAKVLSQIILENFPAKKVAQYEKLDRKIKTNEFHFASLRAGNIPGTHTIGFDSEADTIELRHTARNRKSFALGALMAVKWIASRKGLYKFSDIFPQILSGI